ncbi:MAG: ABC transporter, substrate-binding protein (cluster 5, nickel/peptides/opines) [Candidatus Bipolaricaulis sibiricus]|uniref:ABC transporter, substrate-binding protein (Cluster 5, nickel/peptides/opines) n=1 Tax=Bipolaricaulis sibiricus TaxID=2501609 RepID=A0A410FUC2_BIPS1|nr:MAG: ABC transporter, substrate-binding protein (cluster 5, nickel/peptides/opines) [Candidatus Bipolaricaulis sibiricus]
MKRSIMFGLVAVVLGTWCGLGADLVVAVSTEPPGLDPTTNAAAVIKLLLHHNVYECLVQFDSETNLHGQLATAWEVSEDGLEFTFHIRDGVVFHDGTPCDAEAVRRSFLRTLDPGTGHPNRSFYAAVQDVVAEADRVRFLLKYPYAPFLALLAIGDSVVVPAHRDDLAVRPVGTGPFQFDEWRPADRLILRRNDAYYRPHVPQLDRVIVRFIPDPSAQLAALRAGDVDLVAEVTPQIAYALRSDRGYTVVSGPSNVIQIMAINNARPPLDRLDVRRALAHAIDREAILGQVFFGFGTPIGSHLTPAVPFYADMTHLFPYDPGAAKRLLAEAGYEGGLTLRMVLPSNYAQHVRTGELIAAQLAAVGVRTTIELVDWNTWLDRVFSKADYDLTVVGHPGRVDPALMLTGYGSDRRDYYFRRGWASEELEGLLAEGITTVDADRRRVIYGRVQEILAEEVVNYYIQDMAAIHVMRSRVRGVAVFPVYVLDLTTVEAG